MVKKTVGDKELNFPDDLLYTKVHQWAKIDGNKVTVGITDFAQSQLGDITFADVEAMDGAEVKQDNDGSADPIDCTVESSKAVGDIFCPISGKVVEINGALFDAPEKLNSDPYGDGWLIKVEASNLGSEKGNLLSAADYAATL